MTQPLTHPAWCNPAHCTVVGELLPLTGTAHRSRPVELDLGVFAPGRRSTVSLQLSQAVAPWPTDVFVIASDSGGELLSLRVEAARDLLATVSALLGRAFPIIDDDFPAAIATRHGSPASAEDDHCPVHGEAICVDWLGESDDAENVWVCRNTGTQWRTLVRRPGTGAQFVIVIPATADEWELHCFACARWLPEKHPTEDAANAAAAAHAADHEAAPGGGR
ncbi:hypothetical protein RB614_13355 [Phytohabitans sp. ZYX-F-186]|uniref:Uncharacterized protein n=1 Tax=Phytohabitans maris TaxID=3071409 RepID=A0ABU0ZGD6_9ACTN|nr:hypothetical protein [Phytohabitans sp. ZYX-F-186]MDQ7905511.1 hypothetical protein [Phytohabitans sp. ZYX-F-186]